MTSLEQRGYHLKFFLDDSSEELKDKYKDAITRHNSMVETSNHPDSGFDLYTPLSEVEKLNEGIRKLYDDALRIRSHEVWELDSPMTHKASMKVKTAMYRISRDIEGGTTMTPVGFYLYPRSSISKTNVRLANNTGIIDSGYRGCLAGMFDVISRITSDPQGQRGGFLGLDPYHRLLQICSPTLEPFTVEMVFSESSLGVTDRGSGGFGSTGSN